MVVEWDIYKAMANWFKHGVSISQAVTALEDPNALIMPSTAQKEMRFKLIGEVSVIVRSGAIKVIGVVFSKRGNDVKRIISARPANIDERRGDEERR